MRYLVPSLLIFSATVLAAVQPATAQSRYCLQDDVWGYPGNCQFQTYRQCMATANGASSCAINPANSNARQFPGNEQPIPVYRHKTHRQTHRHNQLDLNRAS